MIEETEKIRLEFMKSQVGKEAEVLIESKTHDGYLGGYTKNYLPVKIKSNKVLCGEICRVRIEKVEGDFCIGGIING